MSDLGEMDLLVLETLPLSLRDYIISDGDTKLQNFSVLCGVGDATE